MDDESRFEHLELDRAVPGVEEVRPTRTFEADDYVKRARDREAMGEHEEALRLYSRALGRKAHHEGAWVGQLRCLIALEDYREALTWADKALEYLPKSASVVALQTIALAREGRHGEAMEHSDRALQMGGTSAVVWLARAWALRTDRPEPAQRCVAKALEVARNKPEELVEIALYFLDREQFGDALELLQDVTVRRPALAQPWYLLGVCHLAMGMRQQALAAFEHAARRAPRKKLYLMALHRAQQQGFISSIWRKLVKQ